MQWWRSCGLLHFGVQFIERSFAPRTPPGTNVADKRLGLHDADVRLFRNREQVVYGVAGGEPASSPVIRQADLVNTASLHEEWTHARSHHHSRLNDAARTGNRRISSMLDREFIGHFRRDLAEEFGLQLCKVRERTAHASGGVMFGESIRGEYVREALVVGESVSIVGALFFLGRRIVRTIGIKFVFHYGFKWLVMRGERTVFESAGDPQPAHAIRMHDEWLVSSDRLHAFCILLGTVIWGNVFFEIRNVLAGPFALILVPPDQLL